MSKIDNFPYPTPIPVKIWGCSVWSRSVMLGSAERGKVRLISRERIPTYMTTIPQRYRRTDRRTTCIGNTALCYASRGKNQFWIHVIDVYDSSHRHLSLCGCQLVFVNQFKYLRHFTDNTFSDDIDRAVIVICWQEPLCWADGLNAVQDIEAQTLFILCAFECYCSVGAILIVL